MQLSGKKPGGINIRPASCRMMESGLTREDGAGSDGAVLTGDCAYNVFAVLNPAHAPARGPGQCP